MAGLIDRDQALAVEQYEAEHTPDDPNRVALAAEATGYIGAGLVIAAVALVVGNRWDDLSTAWRDPRSRFSWSAQLTCSNGRRRSPSSTSRGSRCRGNPVRDRDSAHWVGRWVDSQRIQRLTGEKSK